MVEISQAEYTALVESMYEKFAVGQQPPSEWITQINLAQTQHPEWIIPPPPPPSTNGSNGKHTNGAHANHGLATPPAPPPAPPVPPAAPPRASTVANKGERLQIAVDEDMERIAKEVLTWWGSRFCIFHAGGKLLEVQTDGGKDIEFLAREPDSPRMVAIGSARVRALASRECRFMKEKTGKDGQESSTEQLPPDWLGPAIITRTDFPNIPVFAALAQAPTLRRDGALICEPGYDQSTGIFLVGDLKISIPEHPTLLDAERAVYRLMDLVADFEFTNPAAKSVWLAGLLSVTCRHTYMGPTPLYIFDASKRAAGKTRLADMISLIATGHMAPRMVYTTDDTEMNKCIVALGTSAPQIVLIDNVVGKFSSPSLAAVLTADTYQGRVLSKSEMTPSMPMKMVWFATGNGMVIGADTVRRALLARLEPSVDHPECRSGPRPGVKWRHDPLLDYVAENRAELLGCALTIVSAYIQAGRPSADLGETDALDSMGSYEKWSSTIRSAIVWAGALDPCETVKDARAADPDDLALRTMVACWPAADGEEITAASIIKKAEIAFGDPASASKEEWRNALLGWLPAKAGSPLPTARDLGYALRSIKGSIIENFKIEASNEDKPSRVGILWKRTQISAKILHFETKKETEEVLK